MIKLVFTDAEKDGLQRERHHHPHPSVRLKMEVLWLKSQNLRHQEICRLTGVGSTTLTSYLRAYREGGIEALKIRKAYRPQSDLDAHTELLKAHFQKHPPATTKEAMATIESMTGIRRSPRRIQEFFKRVGMKRRKVGMIPAKADAEAQETFKKKNWSRALKKPRPASGRCFLWMLRISSWHRSWGWFGALSASSSAHLLVGNASMCWVLWTRSATGS